MLYISLEDFYEKARVCRPLSRQEERDCALRMQQGDNGARERLIEGYLPMVAGHIRRAPADVQGLGLVLYCLQALEKAVDSIDFLQDSETFTHRLSWHLRQATAAYIVR